MMRCPGQDQRHWKPDDIFEVACSQCGHPMEFFKDEPQLKCHKCGHTIINPRIDLGCTQWCQHAEQCLGVTLNPVMLIRDKLIKEMKNVFGLDQKRIDHALSVLDYAEQIQAVEGGDPFVVKTAGILHDIGIQEAERKHGSAAGIYQEIEGPPIAEAILKRYPFSAEDIEHICKIIANHHSAKDIDTLEFRILWDADWLVNLQDEPPDLSGEHWESRINKIFKTATGKQIALRRFTP